ncbi:SCO family protein [Ferruginibacter sp.]
MYRIVFLISSSLLLLLGCSRQNAAVLPYYNTPDFTPHFISVAAAKDSVPHTIANFSCIDQNDKTITQQDVEGKIHIANFFFTACGSICPKMMSNLKTTYDQYKNDPSVVFLSFSVTPWRDSVEKLKAYAENNEISTGNWHLLTGSKGDIYKLARTSYFAEEDLGFSKDSSEFLHTEHILLIDKSKRIRGIYNGTLQLETEQLAKDIAALKKE